MSLPLLFLDVDGVVLPFGMELDDLGPDLGPRLTALPGVYFVYLAATVVGYMVLATVMKTVFVRKYGELL